MARGDMPFRCRDATRNLVGRSLPSVETHGYDPSLLRLWGQTRCLSGFSQWKHVSALHGVDETFDFLGV